MRQAKEEISRRTRKGGVSEGVEVVLGTTRVDKGA